MTQETTPPAAEQLVDKKGRPLRGAALKVAQLKARDGKGPRPPGRKARGDRHGDIAASRSSVSTSTRATAVGLRGRLARIW